MLYDNDEDASRRLGSSVIMYKDEPCYLYSQPNLNAEVYTLASGMVERHTFNINEAYEKGDLSLRSIPLGYIKTRDHYFPSYAVRSPVRKYKQGLNSENTNLILFNTGNKQKTIPIPQGLLTSIEMSNLIKGIFTPFNVAYDILTSEEKQSVVISRKVFMYRDDIGLIKVVYQNQSFGFFKNRTNLLIRENMVRAGLGFKLDTKLEDIDISMLEY